MLNPPTLKPHPHYAGGVLKRGFHSENASNVFRRHYNTPEKFENATITGHFGFVFGENSVREI